MKKRNLSLSIIALVLTAVQFSGCADKTVTETIAETTTTAVTEEVTEAVTETTTTEATEEVTEAVTEDVTQETITEAVTQETVTEEVVGIDEAMIREHGKEWYNKYKDKVTCTEQVFVDNFTYLVITNGLAEPDAAFEVYNTYMIIELQEPEETKPAEVTKPVEEEKPEEKPAEVTKPVETTKPKEEKPKDPAVADESNKKPTGDYSDIEWGDDIPTDATDAYGMPVRQAQWIEADGGNFIKVNGRFYRTFQDWVDGKSPLTREEIEGKTMDEITASVGIIEWN